MSTDFTKVLIKDDRLANLTDQITYAVNKGGQQITSAEFPAISQSPSSCIYNIQVPSLETVIDRKVMWTATVRLKITGTGSAATQLLRYGARDCLAPFPLHSMCTNMSATINNNTISCNMKEILTPMLRMLDPNDLAQYNNTTPVAYDQYLNYTDMKVGANNNPFSGYNNSVGNLHPRGSFAPDLIVNSPDLAAMPLNGTEAFVDFTVTEPLLLSPFLFAKTSSNSGGLHGVQNMSFNFNMGYANRVWRHTNGGIAGQAITNVEIVSITKSSLRFFFLSCHPSDQLSSRCVVPYYEMPRFLNQEATLAVATGTGVGGHNFAPGSGSLISNTISLNQIPDKLIIYARKKDANWNDADSFLAIKRVSINFNNNTAICSSFSREQLWRCSVEAGSNQTWDEFRGYAYAPSEVAETTAGAGAGKFVRTSGSLVCLNMAEHVNIVEDFYSSGSIGAFNLQLTVDVENYSSDDTQFELVLITMNSGSFACERGTSTTYTALLTKADVLEASQQQPISHSDAKRMVGGGFLDSLKTVFKWISNGDNRKKVGNVIRTAMDAHTAYSPGKDYSGAKNVLGALGGARSGGGLLSRLK